MNKQQRLQIADAFRACVHRLSTSNNFRGKQFYICLALDESKHPFYKAAQKVVAERLTGCGTLRGWLHREGYINDDNFSQDIQDYRHRWVQELIKEFSK